MSHDLTSLPALRAWQEKARYDGPFQVPEYGDFTAIVREHEALRDALAKAEAERDEARARVAAVVGEAAACVPWLMKCRSCHGVFDTRKEDHDDDVCEENYASWDKAGTDDIENHIRALATDADRDALGAVKERVRAEAFQFLANNKQCRDAAFDAMWSILAERHDAEVMTDAGTRYGITGDIVNMAWYSALAAAGQAAAIREGAD